VTYDEWTPEVARLLLGSAMTRVRYPLPWTNKFRTFIQRRAWVVASAGSLKHRPGDRIFIGGDWCLVETVELKPDTQIVLLRVWQEEV
jgi:hypothetical protein